MDGAGGPRRALLLLEHRRNRELLLDWFRREHDLEPATALGDGAVDVVVADLSAFAAGRERVRALRDSAAPAYVPLLLLVSARQAERIPATVWEDADEVLTTPVRQGELRLRLERLLQVRARSLQTALRIVELGRSNTDLQQFAYAAAHELSNPLTVVAGAIETISVRHGDGLDATAAELLAVARQQSARLQRLIDDLLAYARVGTVSESELVDVGELLDSTLAELRPQIEATGASVERGPLPRLVTVEGQLRLVLRNLVANALKYRRENHPPRIRVSSEERDGEWLVSVADNGIGVPGDQAAAVFDMFARVGATGGEGHGIGLALCRRVIERQGGRIWVEPQPRHGSVFRFTLPAAGR